MTRLELGCATPKNVRDRNVFIYKKKKIRTNTERGFVFKKVQILSEIERGSATHSQATSVETWLSLARGYKHEYLVVPQSQPCHTCLFSCFEIISGCKLRSNKLIDQVLYIRPTKVTKEVAMDVNPALSQNYRRNVLPNQVPPSSARIDSTKPPKLGNSSERKQYVKRGDSDLRVNHLYLWEFLIYS